MFKLSYYCALNDPLFLLSEYATKTCNSDGTWWMHPGLNNSWTNLTLCFPETPEQNHSYKEIIAVSNVLYLRY